MGDEILLYAMLTVGTADATLLHTGMEALDSLEVLAVDIGLAELQFAAGLDSHVQVLGEDAAGQTIFAVVGHRDDLVERLELNQRDDRSEGFLVDDVHLLTTVVEDGGGVEVAFLPYPMAAAEQFRSLADGALHLLGDALKSSLLDQRSHIDRLVGQHIAHPDGLHLLHEDTGERLLHTFLYIHALSVVTDLAVVADTRVDNPLGCTLQVGIVHDDGRSLSAQLEAHLRDILRRGSHDALAGGDRTRDADNVDHRAAGHLVADDAALTRHDVDDTGRQTHLVDHLGKLGAVLGRQLAGLDNDGATGYQGCSGLTGDEEEGEVPRQDACHYADGFLREQDGLVGTVAGNNLPLDMAGEGSHIFEVADGGTHFDRGPRARLSLLAHDNLGELLLALPDALGNLQQIGGTLDGRCLGPCLLGGTSSIESLVDVLDGSFRLT